MTKKKCCISEEPKPLRRSARLIEANAAKIQKKTQEICTTNSLNGVLKSTKKINGVDGFQGCRRSPRFSTPQITDKKSSVKETRFKIQDCQQICAKSRKGAKESTRKKNLQVLSEETCVVDWDDDPLQCAVFTPCMDKEVSLRGSGKRKSSKNGKKSLQLACLREIDTPNKGKANVKCVSNRDLDIDDSPQEMALSFFRTPFSSIENISPENVRENVSNKLVISKGLLNRRVKSAQVAIKQTVRSTNQQCGNQGWTTDQEMALQKAYFGARPSPHFWKKISKLVPGKSAQECFDKIQMDSITTPQPQPRCHSRASRTNPSPLSHFSLSGSKLLESTKLNVKKSKGSKRTKSHAHKAVRHLLQKQNLANQGFKRDLFSILESTTSSFAQVAPEVKVPATPQCKLDTQGFLQGSSSSQKKPFSRFRDSSCLASIVSPPVLKRVKNMAIHERYIDQLHNREAKRTAAGRRRVSASENMKENVKKLDVIKEAKNNLVSEARDMIKKFQHMQANAMDISEDVIGTEGSSGTDDGECSI